MFKGGAAFLPQDLILKLMERVRSWLCGGQAQYQGLYIGFGVLGF